MLGIAAFFSATVCLMIALGAGAKADLRAKHPFPGQLVDVGGYRLHLLCEGRGGPTVVFDGGNGSPGIVWTRVQPDVAAFTRVCVYDRAGYGWSDRSWRPRTPLVMVDELHILLHKAGIPGPYLLVGQSFGGLTMRLYAEKYPDEVAGLVLVDSAHEDEFERFPKDYLHGFEAAVQQTRKQLRLGTTLSSAGLLAFLPARVPAPPSLPAAAAETFRDLAAADPKTFITMSEELAGYRESFAQMRSARITSLGDLPLVVISHGRNDLVPATQVNAESAHRGEEVWQELQRQLAALSSRGRLVIAQHSGHNVHLEQPELVVEAIRRVAVQAGLRPSG